MSLLDTASLICTPNGYKEGKLYSVIPSDGSGDLSVTRATTATRVNSAGLVESMGNNIPRLDYSNGTCPSILVEPQRTNLLQYSSSFDTSPWIGIGTTITPNTQVAPDGTTTGDTYSTSQSQLLLQTVAASTNTTYTLSMWVKLGTATNLCLVANNTAAWNTVGGQSFDSADGLNTSTWTRISWTFNTPSILPAGAINIHLGGNAQTGLTQSTGTVYIWGAQLEVGSYATSYIPTTSASVTRNADVISKTGISSLIGQTEGSVFLDFYYNGSSDDFIPIELYGTGKATLYVASNKIVYYEVSAGTYLAIATLAPLTEGRYKMAFVYKQNDFAFYVNGVLQGTSNSGNVPTMSALNISDLSGYLGTYKQQIEVNALALWKTRLTNTQLAQLTTI